MSKSFLIATLIGAGSLVGASANAQQSEPAGKIDSAVILAGQRVRSPHNVTDRLGSAVLLVTTGKLALDISCSFPDSSGWYMTVSEQTGSDTTDWRAKWTFSGPNSNLQSAGTPCSRINLQGPGRRRLLLAVWMPPGAIKGSTRLGEVNAQAPNLTRTGGRIRKIEVLHTTPPLPPKGEIATVVVGITVLP
jgi:hypothetical protein